VLCSLSSLPTAVAFLIPKLYTMTVLSSLNARPVTHEGANDTVMEKGTQFSITKVRVGRGSALIYTTHATPQPGSMPLNTLAYNARPGQAPDVESVCAMRFTSSSQCSPPSPMLVPDEELGVWRGHVQV
jgi:hypothetical protein